jgi:tetratricopeptide (TPR) repeat protein
MPRAMGISDHKVVATLKLMTRAPDTKLTSDVANELCQRVGSKAYIAGSIASLGTQYVLALKAVNCQSGDVLAQEQATAATKEKVLDALGNAASKLRSELGESLVTAQKFDVPLSEATTSSLEALKAYSLGNKASSLSSAALPYHQHAIELDRNFASGYAAVGWDYASMGQLERAREYFTKAFQLRDHTSEREKLAISADYYFNVTGELDKAAQTAQETIQNYARGPYLLLGVVYENQGLFEKATESYRQYLRLYPDDIGAYGNILNISDHHRRESHRHRGSYRNWSGHRKSGSPPPQRDWFRQRLSRMNHVASDLKQHGSQRTHVCPPIVCFLRSHGHPQPFVPETLWSG